ncbi:MAG: TrmB family transcriptional regulator [Halobacteriota archaeon]
MLLDAKILITLQKLNLTYYEAKVYATLVATGATTATTLSTESEVPRTKIYDVLKRLEEKKWITAEKGRPSIYNPCYPKEVVDERKAILCSELDDCSNELTLMYNQQIEEESQKVWLIRGVDNISAKILETIDRARQNVIMVVLPGTFPFSIVELEHFKRKIMEVKKKDVAVRIVLPPKVFLGDKTIEPREVFRPLMADTRLFPPFKSDTVPNAPIVDPPVSMITLCIDRKETLLMIPRDERVGPDLASVTAVWMPKTPTQHIINLTALDRLWEEGAQIT